jgi:hypothetical protein
VWWYRSLYRSLDSDSGGFLTGSLPTELGTLTALGELYVHCPLPPRLDACITGLWAERRWCVRCRDLNNNGFTGTLPTELGNLDTLAVLCVHRPHTPRLDVCAVTGL